MLTVDSYVANVSAKFVDRYGVKPKVSESLVEERMMRCGAEATMLRADGYDDLKKVAVATLILDDTRKDWPRNVEMTEGQKALVAKRLGYTIRDGRLYKDDKRVR